MIGEKSVLYRARFVRGLGVLTPGQVTQPIMVSQKNIQGVDESGRASNQRFYIFPLWYCHCALQTKVLSPDRQCFELKIPRNDPSMQTDAATTYYSLEILELMKYVICLHYLLPAERDQSVIHRLRSADKLPHIYARTNRFKNSFYLFLC